jgi:hypothetical protein
MKIRLGKLAINLEKSWIPDIPTFGVTNETEDCMFVLFNDYDDVEYDVVVKDIRHVHNVFGLCSFVVLVNSEHVQMDQWGTEKQVGNYLVFGLDRLSYWRCREAQSHMRGDYMHKKISQVYNKRNWVNRIGAKYGMKDGKAVEVKPEPEVKDVFLFKGKCHYQEWFGLKIPLRNMVDDGSIELIEYSTRRKKGGD